MSSIKAFYEKIFGNPSEQTLKQIHPIVDQINALEPTIQALSDEQLKAKTVEFKDRVVKGETLDAILPEAFAVVREAGKRVSGMRHFDVQMIGGVALHRGMIAEMRTGEGKTYVATLPAYLNALAGQGVHVITVNDYLALRDAVWMGQVYDFLGLSVGIIQNQRVSYVYDAQAKKPEVVEGSELDKERDELGSYKVEYDFIRPASRKEAYACDITYGTNNEFGFDYLRDNMVQDVQEMVMRHGTEMTYAIIDEIDSILIDEARTPLIISAPAEEAADQYYQFAKLVRQLNEATDYNIDEKLRSATLTEAGIAKLESALGIENIYAEGGLRTVHHIEQALKAQVLFKRDKDYVVDGQEVVIVDEFTGRKMPGRRYSEGLHQAIEAKEQVAIQRESRTMATITFQNLFRMYKKLSGMTGTAATEEDEFNNIYGLQVLVIPTNRVDKRTDNQDRIYKTEVGKFKAVAEKIKECQAKGQPILVGTISVEKNEMLSNYLHQLGIKHEILNAKNHEREGEIIAMAGKSGAVTLATNMAGRGVDIKLGGPMATEQEKQQVATAGGLFVLGTERHESRRIDNQLRGRAARQGDPGETQFFVSTEDDLMRIFAGDRLKSVMERLKVPDDMPIEQAMITKMLENAQKKVEAHNYDIRKHLLSYDDILNKQRQVIYKKRKQILDISANVHLPTIQPEQTVHEQPVSEMQVQPGLLSDRPFTSLKEMVLEMIEREIEFIVSYHTTEQHRMTPEDQVDTAPVWNVTEVYEVARTIFPFTPDEKTTLLAITPSDATKLDEVTAREQLVRFLMDKATKEYDRIELQVQSVVGDGVQVKETMKAIEKSLLLRAIDTIWVDHLVNIDYLRTGIGLRGYGQRDPLIEYKKEAFQMFIQLQEDIQKEVAYSFYKVGIGVQIAPSVMADDKLTLQGSQMTSTTAVQAAKGGAGTTNKKKESKKERKKRQREERGIHT